ncbi:glycine--tRNA ligase subunit beta [Candidatus Tremblaya phenacola]|uniref:glycine--tRNA ligase subunit beta n=1 Tax=Candidatus Tremblayella phenacoccinincola TaxID=1010676 RepID=UPI001330176F|nr:glycine--tRNA ligase subunit beta [Candidatus Tremblaya phenacola]KAH0998176.1 Glycyl-tRNA synthetase beta chain [Candidatus Tremblaya phenacola]
MTCDFIVAFGLEELPYDIILTIAQSFMSAFRKELNKLNISYGTLFVLYTPRKLVLKVNKISKSKNNIYPEKERLYDIVFNSLKAFTSFKSMYWNGNETGFKFIRPLHTLTIFLNNKKIHGSILGTVSNSFVNGHRHIGDKSICISHANSYLKLLLERGKVIADYCLRSKIVYDKAKTIAKPKGVVNIDSSLLAEVTSMVEWVTVFIGAFNKSFLIIPKEILVFAIKTNQKYFPISEAEANHKHNHKLLPYFIYISNIIPNRTSKVISDNQKVICPRLIDAIYFISKDRYKRLEHFIPELNIMLFEKSLGTLRESLHRIEYLSSWVSQHIGTNHINASRAGLLSKCDLATKMVYEFKDLYGFVGMYHAEHDDEPKEVALALMEQYLPRVSNDILPTTLVGCSVGISDKADNIIGIIGVNGVPKGNKDPYSSKRFIIGIFRIIIENRLILNIKALIKKTVSTYGNKLINKKLTYLVAFYYLKKLKGWYLSLGYSSNTISSVLGLSIEYPLNIHIRICLLRYIQRLKGFKHILEANKRITNIFIKLSYISNRSKLNRYLFRNSEEVNIYKQHMFYIKKIGYLLDKLDFSETSLQLLKLSKQICGFFKDVFILDKPKPIRNNRLVLLNKLKDAYIHIADMSYFN